MDPLSGADHERGAFFVWLADLVETALKRGEASQSLPKEGAGRGCLPNGF